MTEKTETIEFHPIWLRIMYIVNIVLTLPMGLALLIAPTTVLSFFGFPTQEPIWAATGYSVMVATGIVAIAGLRSPLKFSPILVFQILEKLIWLIVIIAPRAIAGTLPTFAMLLIAIYVPLTIGNLIAVPWKYIFAK